jgi:hypothetical protein
VEFCRFSRLIPLLRPAESRCCIILHSIPHTSVTATERERGGNISLTLY